MAQSMTVQKANSDDPAQIMEKVITQGDLSKLSPADRTSYYNAVCQSLGLNPLTRPFEYITLSGRLTLYARKDATEQLRRIHRVSIGKLENQVINDCLIVTAHASSGDGRRDTATGVVYLKGLIGDALANAMMRAETKAKRRVTLSICGLGLLDESEISSIPNAQPIAEEEIVVSSKANGLDQWKCGRKLAMELIGVCNRLEAAGVSEEEMRAKLPQGIASRKDLSPEQAQQVILDFNQWLDSLTNTIQGEVV